MDRATGPMDGRRSGLSNDREDEGLRPRAFAPGGGGGDLERVAPQLELPRRGDAPPEAHLVDALVSGEGERAQDDGARAARLAAILGALRDALATHLSSQPGRRARSSHAELNPNPAPDSRA